MRKNYKIFLLIVAISALAYLPLVAKFGYTSDDWYLMWAAKTYGTQAFYAIFSGDRPLRAFLMIPAYTVFGENPLGYNLSAYVLRVLGGLAFWWLLKMLWPKASQATAAMALLFVIYPGFLSQPNAIDYQSHIAALALAMLSLALTVTMLVSKVTGLRRVGLQLASILSGWLYLGLMEYYIGFEIIRVGLILLLALRTSGSWLTRIKTALLHWLPLSLTPILFLYWHTFIFVSERNATDTGTQLAALLVSPLSSLLGLGLSLLKSAFAVLVSAWTNPLSQLVILLSPWQILAGLGLGLLAVLGTWLILNPLPAYQQPDWRMEALFLGAVSLIGGLIPVVFANREVYYPTFSRYAIISSSGAVMLLVTIIFLLPHKVWRQAALSVFVMIAIFTHFGNSVRAAQESTSMNAFWWQVAWRIPMLEENTTLIVSYPLVSILEDYFVWGPANLIYYTKQVNTAMQPQLYAAAPSDATTQSVLNMERQVYDKRRDIITYANYRNMLVLTQPTSASCVRAVDGSHLENSLKDSANILKMSPFSESDHIVPKGPFAIPPQSVFGAEPPRTWCYYYQKASYAREISDWSQVVALGNAAFARGFSPSDPIEWMPFLQGYALKGQTDSLNAIALDISDTGTRQKACALIKNTAGVSKSVLEISKILFCEP